LKLPPVDGVQVERSSRREDEQRGARRQLRDGLLDSGRRGQDGSVDITPRRLHAGELEPLLSRVEPVDVVPASPQQLDEEIADETAPDDEDSAARNSLECP
jgi:hypothetical protein